MKTKEETRDLEVGVMSVQMSTLSAPSGLSGLDLVELDQLDHSLLSEPLNSSSDEGMDTSSLVMKEPNSPMVMSPQGLSDMEEDSSSESDGSDWEDIEEEEDDDVCILFEEGCGQGLAIVGTNQKVCFSLFTRPAEGSSPSCSKSPDSDVLGSHPNACWVSQLAQNCQKRLKSSCPFRKKVRFNEKELVRVIEFEDDEESKQMRGKYWETFHIDRCRFKERVKQTEEAIGHIFEKEHRDKMYEERFQIQSHQNEGLPAACPAENRITQPSSPADKNDRSISRFPAQLQSWGPCIRPCSYSCSVVPHASGCCQ